MKMFPLGRGLDFKSSMYATNVGFTRHELRKIKFEVIDPAYSKIFKSREGLEDIL